MQKYLLGIDNGSTVSKAALFTTAGEEIATAARKVSLIEPKPGFSERDMDQTWTSTAEAISQVLAESSIDPGEIAAIACTGHGNGIYLVDEQGATVMRKIQANNRYDARLAAEWTFPYHTIAGITQ